MENDIIRKMNHALGIGLSLGVRDNQRFELLRESHRQDAENERLAREAQEAGAEPRKPATHVFRGEKLPGPPLEKPPHGL